MNTLKNYITLIGKIGTDAQYTKFGNGRSVARFKLSTQKTERKNNGKYMETTQWHSVFAWGNLAEFIEHYAQKGKKVAIHGRIVNRTYLNPAGVKRNKTEIEIRNIIGLS